MMSEKNDIVDGCQRLKLECKPIADKVYLFYSFFTRELTLPTSKYHPRISVGGKTLITLTKIRNYETFLPNSLRKTCTYGIFCSFICTFFSP